jgi:hypothetical protein
VLCVGWTKPRCLFVGSQLRFKESDATFKGADVMVLALHHGLPGAVEVAAVFEMVYREVVAVVVVCVCVGGGEGERSR